MRDLPREVVWETIHEMGMDECTVMAKRAGVKCVFEGEYEGFPVCDECIDRLCDWLYEDEPDTLICHFDDPIAASTIASKGKLCVDEHENKFKKAADLFEEAIEEQGYGSHQCEIQLFRMMEAANILDDRKNSRVPIRSYGCANMAKGLVFDVLNRQICYGKEPLDLSELAKLALTLLDEEYIYSREQRTENIESIIHPFLYRIGNMMEITPNLMWDVAEKEFVDDVFTPLTYVEAADSLIGEEGNKLDVIVKLFEETVKDKQYGEEEISEAIKKMLILAKTQIDVA